MKKKEKRTLDPEEAKTVAATDWLINEYLKRGVYPAVAIPGQPIVYKPGEPRIEDWPGWNTPSPSEPSTSDS